MIEIEDLLKEMEIDTPEPEAKKETIKTIETFLCPRCEGMMTKTSTNRFESIIGINPFKCKECGLITDVYKNQWVKRKVILIEIGEIILLVFVLWWVL